MKRTYKDALAHERKYGKKPKWWDDLPDNEKRALKSVFYRGVRWVLRKIGIKI